MKKIIFSLVLLVGFALSTMTVQSSFAQDGGGTPLTHADNEGGGGSNVRLEDSGLFLVSIVTNGANSKGYVIPVPIKI